MDDNEYILDTSQIDFNGDFEEQVTKLLAVVRLTRSEVEGLQKLFEDLTHIVSQMYPGCEVHPFGSIVTGLGMKTSDVDCYISLPHWVKQDRGFIVGVKNLLSRYRSLFRDLFAIPMAKVPIVKFFHIPTQRHCDINFKSPAGVKNSRLMAYLLHLDKQLVPFAVIVKYWCKVHNLTGTNFAPNYAMMILLIFYLQQQRILPSVSELQYSIDENMVDNWNIAFNDSFNYTKSNANSLYTLCGGFFEFYSKFNFEDNVVSPYLGCEVKRSEFSDVITVRNEFFLYKQNVRNKICRALQIEKAKMCVQDPFEHSRNCAAAVFPSLFDKFILLCKKAAKAYAENSSSEFLKLILSRDPSIDAETASKNKLKRLAFEVAQKGKKPQNKVGKQKNLYNKYKMIKLKEFYMNGKR